MTLPEIKRYRKLKAEKKFLDRLIERKQSSECDEKRLILVNKKLKRIKRFILLCDNPFIKDIMKYRFLEELSWDMVSARIGGGNSPDSCRMAVNRYFQGLKKEINVR